MKCVFFVVHEAVSVTALAEFISLLLMMQEHHFVLPLRRSRPRQLLCLGLVRVAISVTFFWILGRICFSPAIFDNVSIIVLIM